MWFTLKSLCSSFSAMSFYMYLIVIQTALCNFEKYQTGDSVGLIPITSLIKLSKGMSQRSLMINVLK